MYYVYILMSMDGNRTYVGSTNDVVRRLEEHNRGKVKSSKSYAPYKIFYKETFNSFREARAKEAYFKTTSGRRELKKIIESRNISQI